MNTNSTLTRFEQWILKQMCKKLVRQGPSHTNNIKEYYRRIIDAARIEFREDNIDTLNSFMEGIFKETIKESTEKEIKRYGITELEWKLKYAKERLGTSHV